MLRPKARETVTGAAYWRLRTDFVAGIWVCVSVTGTAFGSCVEGLDVVERAARGAGNVTAARLRTGSVAGAVFSAAGPWQGLRLVAVEKDWMLSSAWPGVRENVIGLFGPLTLEPPAQSADIVLSLFSFFLSLVSLLCSVVLTPSLCSPQSPSLVCMYACIYVSPLPPQKKTYVFDVGRGG